MGLSYISIYAGGSGSAAPDDAEGVLIPAVHHSGDQLRGWRVTQVFQCLEDHTG